MDKIAEIRKKINKGDNQIIELLEERMACLQEIAALKKADREALYFPEQDCNQLNMLMAKFSGSEFEQEFRRIFTEIYMSGAKAQGKAAIPYNIYLIGFMGAGKSSVASELERRLMLDTIEMDQIIVEQTNMSISDIFSKHGEEHFRALETNLLIQLQQVKHKIVSCGGGVPMRDVNTEQMKKNGRIVLLKASPETIYERVKDCKDRPILNDNMNVEFIASLMEKRRERYEHVADLTVSTDGKSVGQICQEIIAGLYELDQQN
ncbi:MAG: shikimate kinase [Lachnospiraceae bacterium]